MVEDEGKKDEEKFEFDSTGEALGYISLDQAEVLAMRTARETPGAYGRRFTNVPMAFEVVEADETEDHYRITISLRPEGEFAGRPGREQFFIEKEGAIVLRQVLSLPGSTGWRRYRLAWVVIGLVVVAAAAVGGVFAATSRGGSDDAAPVAAALPTSTPERPAPTTDPVGIPPVVPTPTLLPVATPTPAQIPILSTVSTSTPTPVVSRVRSRTRRRIWDRP